MAEATIDKLSIEIGSNAGVAVNELDRLASSLDRLAKTAGSPIAKLNNLATSLNRLKQATSGLNTTPLERLRNIKLSATLPENLNRMSVALRNIPNGSASEIAGVASALTPLGTVKISSTLPSSIERLSAAMANFPAGASNQLRALSSALVPLNGLKISSTLPNNIQRLAVAVTMLPAGSVAQLRQLSTALQPLRGLTISATLPNNLTRLATAVRMIPVTAAVRLQQLATALQGFTALAGLRLNGPINQIARLPEILERFQNINIGPLIQQIRTINEVLGPLARNINLLARSINALPRALRTEAGAANAATRANRGLSAQFYSGTTNSVRFVGRISALTGALFVLSHALASCINEANSYIENMNLFNASMGEFAQSAAEYAQKVQELMGIDAGEWMRNQGIFQSLATGMGVAADKASIMSQNLTQLGYDIASFYNLQGGAEEAMLKIQSGIAGELEPLRRLGWDLSNARMQLELTNRGIDANVASMTQAEKVALRYYLIMNQMTQVHGDMARTIASPANQLRILQAQVRLAAREIGNLLIPALNLILPYAIAAAKAIRILAQQLANFFGIDVTFEVDYSTLDTSGITMGGGGLEDTSEEVGATEEVADAVEDVGTQADESKEKVEELKRTILGFDEINKLNAEDALDADAGDNGAGAGDNGAGGPDTSGLGAGLDLPLDTYDFLDGLNDKLARQTDELAAKMVEALKRILPVVAGIGAAIAAWKIGNALYEGLQNLRGWLSRVRGDIDDINKRAIAPRVVVPAVAPITAPIQSAFGQMWANVAAMGSRALSGIPGPVLAASAAAGILTTHFVNLALNSENFQGGLKVIGDYFAQFPNPLEAILNLLKPILDFVGNIAKGIGEWVSNAAQAAVEFLKSLGIDITPIIEGFQKAAQWITDTFGPIVTAVFDGISFLLKDVFDIQWTDYLTTAAAFVLNLIPGWGQVASAILLVGEAISLVIRAIGWANEPIVEMQDALEGVSDETKTAFGTAADSYSQMVKEMDALNFSDAVVSQEDVDSIGAKTEDIKNTILSNLDARRNEELASIDALAGVISEEDMQKMRDSTNAYYDEQATLCETGASQIAQIMQTARDENRALTEDENRQITELREQLKNQLIETSGATEEEMSSIAQKLKDNETAAAAEAASEVIKSAKEECEGRKAAAEDNYNNQKAILDRMLADGQITTDEYDRQRQAIEDAYNEEKTAADDAYNSIVAKTQEAMGETANKIDWTTGEIKTNWQVFCDNVSNAWQNLCNGISDWYNNNIKPTFDRLWEAAQSTAQAIQQFLSDPVGAIEAAWSGLCGWFQSTVLEPLQSLFRSVANFFIDMMNGVIDALNWFHVDVPDWVPGVGGRSFGFNIPHLQRMAQGGFVEQGQLFMAREAGPELVGTMGGRNAVANNDQIVEGIEQGVMRGMMQAMIFNNQTSESEGDLVIPLVIGNEEIARAVGKGYASLVRRGELVPQFI